MQVLYGSELLKIVIIEEIRKENISTTSQFNKTTLCKEKIKGIELESAINFFRKSIDYKVIKSISTDSYSHGLGIANSIYSIATQLNFFSSNLDRGKLLQGKNLDNYYKSMVAVFLSPFLLDEQIGNFFINKRPEVTYKSDFITKATEFKHLFSLGWSF